MLILVFEVIVQPAKHIFEIEFFFHVLAQRAIPRVSLKNESKEGEKLDKFFSALIRMQGIFF